MFRRLLLTASCLLLCVASVLLPVSTAWADARDGTCAAGYRLESYTYSEKGYNAPGQLMWKITWRKRWCYSIAKRRVGTVYAPKPAVEIYSLFSNAWRNRGVVSSDSYYANIGATGVRHPNYPRWGHVSWHKVKLDHCAVKYALCTSHYYRVGTISYWDGSKKLILP